MSCKKNEEIFLDECPHCHKEIKIITHGEHSCEIEVVAEELLICDSCGVKINTLAGEGGKCIQCGKVGCIDEWCDIGWDPTMRLCNNCKYFYILENWFEPDERLLNKKFEINSDSKFLGIMTVERGIVIIRPSELVRFTEDEPLFKSFFMDEVLNKMELEDQKALKNKQIKENQMISYKISKYPDNTIREIKIKHFRTYKRVIDIKNGISWTFEILAQKKV
ncbi:MAG: hypothetical protein ACTSRG_12240 [Candidatus Helarchaeota archaeon]